MKLQPSNSTIAAGPRRAGVALVITLIMVSVIAFMAITFLILSSRERGSVNTTSAQTDAKLAADSALQRATAQLMAGIIVSSNRDNYALLVSTNYINPLGFNDAPGPNDDRRTNVNYDYYSQQSGQTPGSRIRTNGAGIDDQLNNLVSLYYDPRPPVFITNPITGGTEFRYYLDLNRNGRFETNGIFPTTVTTFDPKGTYVDTSNRQVNISFPWPANTVQTLHVGDPEWIGILERPEAPHSSSNKFVARFAFIALPAGKTLDVNYIHNYARGIDKGSPTLAPSASDEGFLRNQGVGSWELNLAAFLTDLNTNTYAWPAYKSGDSLTYNYVSDNNGSYQGFGIPFDDALEVVRYRYGTNVANQPSVSTAYPNAATLFAADDVDEYADGELMLSTNHIDELNPPPLAAADKPALPWSGSDNLNRYYSQQDFFNTAKGMGGFLTHLRNTGGGPAGGPPGGGTNDYDRYTFYRMLDQLGTDSSPESGRINLNYDNLTPSNGVVNVTNYLTWQPLVFFTNAANHILEQYSNQVFLALGTTNFPGSITNIEIYPTNRYTPAVHHALQFAANLFDATTNSGVVTNPPPTVFQPVFVRTNFSTNVIVYIAGYQAVTDAAPVLEAMLHRQSWDLNNTDVNDTTNSIRYINKDTTEVMSNLVYGVPFIVGARKGMPNFNEFVVQNAIRVSRDLYFYNPDTNKASAPVISAVNQGYELSISNSLAGEFWNSYSNRYPRGITMFVKADYIDTVYVTNDVPVQILRTNVVLVNSDATRSIPGWEGTLGDVNRYEAFKLPEMVNIPAKITNNLNLMNTQYVKLQDPSHPGFSQPYQGIYGPGENFPIPHWGVLFNFRLQGIIVDTNLSPWRIVDYVSLSKAFDKIDVMQAMTNRSAGTNSAVGELWITTNLSGFKLALPSTLQSIPYGIYNQIQISRTRNTLNGTTLSQNQWEDFGLIKPASSIDYEKDVFNARMGFSTKYPKVSLFKAPFSPGRVILQDVVWRANDPLVHYILPDVESTNIIEILSKWDATDQADSWGSVSRDSRNHLNPNYQPWNPPAGKADTEYSRKLEYIDPLANSSDSWDFPTNKFPNLGWMGRVHRGTPWQTAFLKAGNATLATNNLYPPDKTDLPNWTNWSGDLVLYLTTNKNGDKIYLADAALTHPTNDWALLNLFTTAPNDNATRGRLNVNQTNLAAWSAVLSGVPVLVTNSFNDLSVHAEVIEPAGNVAGSPVQTIVEGINAERSRAIYTTNAGIITTNYVHAGQAFGTLGEVLSAPELTVQSPYLGGVNGTNFIANSTNTTINDEVVERIPQQVLSLLRAGENPRFVIYAYGQALKPAENSIIQRSGFSGLCTNYQITGEVALRAVVGTTNENGNWRAIIESYNTLSPDY